MPRRLQEDRLPYDPVAYLSVWRELERLVDAGKLRSIGTSNMTAAKLSGLLASARIPPAVNQVELHPFLAQNEFKAWCDRKGIVLTAYSPLGSPDRPARLVDAADPVPLSDPTVTGIAAKHNVAPAAVLIRWAIQRGTVVIPKSVTASRIADNLAAANLALSEEEMAALNGLDRGSAGGGRVIKGFPWLLEGQTWQSLWDEGVYPE
jgi:alcohol dehydrogenase (NADP+)